MRDFSSKYDGDIQAALRGLQREKMGGDVTEIDKTTRKRKWVASQEVEGDVHWSAGDADTSKAVKNGECIISIAEHASLRPLSSPDPGITEKETWFVHRTGNSPTRSSPSSS